MPATLGQMLLVASLSGAGAVTPAPMRSRAVSPHGMQRPGAEKARPDAEDSQALPSPAGGRRVESHRYLPPALLTRPTYYGTLAAVRALGRSAIPVTTAGSKRWSIASCSKYATNHVSCPPTSDTAAFIDWLVDFGRRQAEKHVLLPTCDDTAWLYARYRERLLDHYYLSPSNIDAIHSLLHKGQLASRASEVGLSVPRTWYPRSAQEASQVAEEATFPVLLKPVTQILFAAGGKGLRVDRAEQLPAAYADYSTLTYGRAIVDYDPSIQYPMVQEYFPSASDGIYNISSYAQDGKLWGARAGRKILQRPRRLGVGICFEEAPLEPELVEGVERLIRRVGYSGVFETEFVRVGDRSVIIDFNPRFYNQMGFDVARGLPLPTLAYFGALGRQQPDELTQQAMSGASPTEKVFAYGAAFHVMVASQRLSGKLSAEEADTWLAWYAAHEGRRVDAVQDPEDPWPGRLDLMQMVQRHVRYPGEFMRTVVLNR